jgi:hypothetical protein
MPRIKIPDPSMIYLSDQDPRPYLSTLRSPEMVQFKKVDPRKETNKKEMCT